MQWNPKTQAVSDGQHQFSVKRGMRIITGRCDHILHISTGIRRCVYSIAFAVSLLHINVASLEVAIVEKIALYSIPNCLGVL